MILRALNHFPIAYDTESANYFHIAYDVITFILRLILIALSALHAAYNAHSA